jgi:hypothetical protein
LDAGSGKVRFGMKQAKTLCGIIGAPPAKERERERERETTSAKIGDVDRPRVPECLRAALRMSA